ncbi:MAG: biopolymer transporter ExbD [Candidatus Omnitrophica bacterium]|nr:biopolymer transporter ExbD [Candidatus Omnitrophota bacterium]
MIAIKGKKDYLVALESVAMTDIVMNMFIFFFISFSLIYTFNPVKMSKIEVKLPKASTAVALEGFEKVMLTITKDGDYFINEDKVKDSDIKSALEAKLKENNSIGVVLKVDGSARFNNVVKALDVINELNIQKVSVAAVKN